MTAAPKKASRRRAQTRAKPPAVRHARRWWIGLAGLMLWGLVCQVLILTNAWRENPFAIVPAQDADTYWNRAAHIAAGQLLEDTPFMSGPLYPYLLGGVRALGGGLPAVYGLQVGLYLSTAGLLTCGAARRFGARTGLLTGLLFILLTEPAFFTGRVLSCTLHLFCATVLWLSLLRAQRQPALAAWGLVGAVAGMNCLANPAALLVLALLAVWTWWQNGRGRRGATCAAVLVGVAALVISPATIHNYVVSKEFIPVSAQAGVTFAHGNAPGAVGTYTPIAGISEDQQLQNIDALRFYRQAAGEAGGWNAANRFFFRQGLSYWADHPGQAVALLLRKTALFLTSQNIGDIYMPRLERTQGYAKWLYLAPVPVAWLMLPALVGLFALARRPGYYGPELAIFSVPLLVVVVFFFSPRYRLPAVPMVAVTCAWALAQAAQWRTHRNWSLAVATGLIVGIGLGPVKRVAGFDRVGPYQADFHYNLANAFRRSDRLDQAAEHYRRAFELRPDFPMASLRLGRVLLQLGRIDEAVTPLKTAVRLLPDEAAAHHSLAQALARQGDTAGAREHFHSALRVDSDDAVAHLNLGILDRRGGALAEALRHFEEALRCDPALVRAHVEMAGLLYAGGDAPGCIASLRRARELAPDDAVVAYTLAWRLATTPGLNAADRADALRLAAPPRAGAGRAALGQLDTRAAALAANGRFAEAVITLEQAITLARKLGLPDGGNRLRPRLELYRAGKPYVAPF